MATAWKGAWQDGLHSSCLSVRHPMPPQSAPVGRARRRISAPLVVIAGRSGSVHRYATPRPYSSSLLLLAAPGPLISQPSPAAVPAIPPAPEDGGVDGRVGREQRGREEEEALVAMRDR